MLANSNVAVLLTPRAGSEGSAIAVVRLSGPSTAGFLSRYFSGKPRARRSVHGNLRDGETVVDDVVVVVGEEIVWADICLHGGAWVIESTLNLARREGFEVVEDRLPLPAQAVDGGDEVEREVLAWLPLARTRAGVKMLLDQPQAWAAAKKLGFDSAAVLGDRTLRRLLHPPEIAIVGEPNVGKSTLANRLFGQERSITADVPGTTRDWVGELADIGGMPAVLIDTPGVRETEDAIERAAIVASGERISQVELTVRVLDASAEDGPHPSPLPAYRERENEIVVVNKIDLKIADLFPRGAIGISARTGEGIELLCAEIHRRLGVEAIEEPRMRWWTERQREEIRFRI